MRTRVDIYSNQLLRIEGTGLAMQGGFRVIQRTELQVYRACDWCGHDWQEWRTEFPSELNRVDCPNCGHRLEVECDWCGLEWLYDEEDFPSAPPGRADCPSCKASTEGAP